MNPTVRIHQSDEVVGLIQRDLAGLVRKLFPLLHQLHERETHGGYLCLADVHTGIPFLLSGFGYAPEEKWPKYLALCQEKALRLASYLWHRTSAQSRDEAEGKYGGAIRGRRVIIAFSGLPWELDEAFCLLLAIGLGEATQTEAIEMARLSGNTRFDEALTVSKRA